MDNTNHRKGKKSDSGVEEGTEGWKSARTGKGQDDQPQSRT